MHELVRNLYKRFILAGKSYPLGLSHIREKVKEEFFKNKNISKLDELEIKRAVARGRYSVKEIQKFSQFHKYRSISKRY